jgi:RNA polymerase sigma-70 factor (ECF subfamily)
MSASEVFLPEDDQSAFSAVYRTHHAKLVRYCEYRLRDRHEAEDVAQEAFVRAWRSMPTTAFDRNFYPWLRVVAGNLCTDLLRKRSRSEPVAVIDVSTVDRDLDRLTEEADRAMVRQALGRLNDRHRSALLMRESEGLTYDQIAQRTGVTSGTVESLLWRARQALKREFTVVAGREGSLAIVPFVAFMAGRVRSAGRHAWLRVARRIPGWTGSSEAPVAHAALAAFAALTVAAGAVATFGWGGGHDGGPTLATGSQPAAALVVPASTASSAIAAPVPASASTSVPPVLGAPVPSPAAASPSLPPALAAAGSAATAPLTVRNPVVVGRSAADDAYNAPVTVGTGPLAVGLAPQVATDYVQSVVKRVAPSVPISTPSKEKPLP